MMTEEIIEIVSEYDPSPKQSEFHRSPAFIKLLMGGYGSGKTRSGIEEVNHLLAEYPGIIIYVMRKTMPSLRDSTLHEFHKYIDQNLGRYQKKTDNFDCINSSQIRFRGLDEASKLKGPEPAVIFLDEADEFTYEDFLILKARLRQTRDQKRNPGPEYPLHMILVCNPVDDWHWISQQFFDNAEAYRDAGGLLVSESSTYDNIKNLPKNYIATTTAGMTPDEIDRYIFGKRGTIVKGKPVYGDVLNPQLHLEQWKFDKSVHTLLRGWDFGFNRPACVFRLKDPLNRKNIDFAMLGNREFLDVFAEKVMVQTIERYGTEVRIFDYCDPRGHDKSQNSKEGTESAVAILNELGIQPIGERHCRDYVEPGIRLVRKEFSTLIQGRPELTINPECALMRAAYFGKYVRGDDGSPVKEGYYEHPCDADRMISWNDRSNAAVRDAIIRLKEKREAKKPRSVTGYR